MNSVYAILRRFVDHGPTAAQGIGVRRLRLVLALAAIVLLAGRAPQTWACSCTLPQDPLGGADVAFEGLATDGVRGEIRWDPVGEISGSRWTFRVDRRLKGRTDKVVRLETPFEGGSCGFEFRIGRRYRVFADRQTQGNLMTFLCSGNAELAGDLPPPHEGPRPPDASVFQDGLAWVAVLALVGLLALAVHRSLPRREPRVDGR